jgi:hypothetical protein
MAERQPDGKIGRPGLLGALVAEHYRGVPVRREDLDLLDQIGYLARRRTGAQTRTSASADRSMCFLSSTASVEIVL